MEIEMIEKLKAEFSAILTGTNRNGISAVLNALETIGFFESPASARHHLAENGGLVKHSLNVYSQAKAIAKLQIEMDGSLAPKLKEDSIAIAALLHDVCKAGVYKPAEKFRKDAAGRWEKYWTYEYDYSGMPIGHGEKSVIRLLRMGLELTNDEIIAIRWHMANWDMADSMEAKSNFSAACEKCPLLSVLIAADELATRITETEFPK